MPRTPLYAALRRIGRTAAAADTPALTRRAVLGGAAATAMAVTLPARAAELRVAVVGAGLAGLTATDTLRQAGVRATLFEASTRLGGRCWTIRDAFPGQIAEHGGEFIDSDHHPIRNLAHDLGLHLDDVLAAQPAGTDALYWFDGAPYSRAQAEADYQALYPIVQQQSAAIGDVSYRGANATAVALDHQTVAAWVAQNVVGGRSSRLGQLIENAVTEELAADTDQLSAINALYLFAPNTQTGFDLYYPGSDQRFHVRGGNDQIVSRLAARLDGQIRTGTALERIERLEDGRFRLGFARDCDGEEAVFDRVILALPFSVMRERVEYGRAGFRPLKRRAIQELGMGHSVKFQLQFERRVWNAVGCTGEIRLPSPVFQTTWEPTRAQRGPQAVLNFWSGGTRADRAGATDPQDLARRCLVDASVLLPGLPAAWNGRMVRDVWARNPWALGSYAYPPLGYMSQVMGIEPEPEGHCYFAGEHTYVAQTGYLNAGVASGQRAARQVLASLV